MSKNIEKIKGEEALSEIVDITLDDAKLNGLVSNDVADMYQSASGLRPLKPTDTYESSIVELKANLKLIFRQLFSVPLTILGSNKAGSPISIIKMIEQMFNHYRERLKGSEEYGIPSRLDQLTDLPSAPLLVADRKISGVPEAEDGMSLVNLLGSDERLAITKLQDDNYGYENNMPIDITSFPNVNELTIGAERIDYGTPKSILTSQSVKTLHIAAKYARATFNIPADGTLYAPNLEEFFVEYGGGPNCKIIYMPKFRNPNGINIFRWWQTDSPLNMKIMILGSVESGSITNWLSGTADRLIHFEFGADGLGGLKISMNLSWWTATNCLDESRTDLIEEGSTATNNLQQFLQNFKTYILLRLAPMTSGTTKTLTLSAAVYRAIYGLDNSDVADQTSAARTLTLADLGVTELTDIEIAAGITLDTLYYSAIDTYRGAIYWNIAK